ncbi:hypothetical protein HHI36_020479 [Cryptolaemus montrouzieri]|uniref:FLYWCH-type domain-containing protein n=1 Tax=Cryptolaemus montrouzieri TaxID=559131 RepID=A0ABD2NAV6_9CUCU
MKEERREDDSISSTFSLDNSYKDGTMSTNVDVKIEELEEIGTHENNTMQSNLTFVGGSFIKEENIIVRICDKTHNSSEGYAKEDESDSPKIAKSREREDQDQNISSCNTTEDIVDVKNIKDEPFDDIENESQYDSSISIANVETNFTESNETEDENHKPSGLEAMNIFYIKEEPLDLKEECENMDDTDYEENSTSNYASNLVTYVPMILNSVADKKIAQIKDAKNDVAVGVRAKCIKPESVDTVSDLDGNMLLVVNNYLFKFNFCKKLGLKEWICKSQQRKCHANCYTQNDGKIVRYNLYHKHPPDLKTLSRFACIGPGKEKVLEDIHRKTSIKEITLSVTQCSKYKEYMTVKDETYIRNVLGRYRKGIVTSKIKSLKKALHETDIVYYNVISKPTRTYGTAKTKKIADSGVESSSQVSCDKAYIRQLDGNSVTDSTSKTKSIAESQALLPENMIEPKLIDTIRDFDGDTLLVVNNYMFGYNSISHNGIKEWFCEDYYKACQAKCYTQYNGKIVRYNLNHQHPPNFDRLGRLSCIAEGEQKILEDVDGTTTIEEIMDNFDKSNKYTRYLSAKDETYVKTILSRYQKSIMKSREYKKGLKGKGSKRPKPDDMHNTPVRKKSAETRCSTYHLEAEADSRVDDAEF